MNFPHIEKRIAAELSPLFPDIRCRSFAEEMPDTTGTKRTFVCQFFAYHGNPDKRSGWVTSDTADDFTDDMRNAVADKLISGTKESLDVP